MKARSTKKALVMSMLSMLLCFAMLAGTTFAWFTDSVTSSANKIVAGTLKIDLELLETDGTWTSIKNNPKPIFDYDKWEPGYTAVKILKIENEGSLALKWKALFVSSQPLSALANVIDVYVLPTVPGEAAPAYPTADQRDLAALGYTRVGTVAEFVNTIEQTTNGVLLENESAYLGIALVMQTSAGNEYQGLDLGGAFDIQIAATQMTAEDDSFDDQYDKDATYPILSQSAPMPEAGATAAPITLNTVKGEGADAKGVTVVLPADTVEEIGTNAATKDTTTLSIVHSVPTISAADKSVSFDAIDIVDQNGNIIDLEAIGNTADVTVTVPVGNAFEAGELVVVYHDGEAIASATVATDKTITYTTKHFCRVDISFGDGSVDSLIELETAIAKGGSIKLEADVELSTALTIPAGVAVVLDLNGKTLNGGYQAGNNEKHIYTIENRGTLTLIGDGVVNGRGVANYGTLVVNGGTYNAIDTNGGGAIWNYAGANVTINGGTFTAADDTVSPGATVLNNATGATATINGGTFIAQADQTYAIINDGNLTINDIAISSDHGVIATSGTAVLNGGTYQQNGNLVQTSSLLYITGGTTTVKGGAYKFNVEGKLDSGLPVYCAGGSVAISGGIFTGYVTEMISSWGGAGTASVSGGTFSKNPGFVADGYKVFDNGDGTFTVKENVAKVATAAELAAAINGTLETVLLTADITLSDTLVINRNVTFDLGGHTLSGQLGTLVKIAGGNVILTNGALSNEHAAATDTKYSLYLTGDAVATVTNMTIATSGTGIYLDGNAKITELNAKVSSYHTANGYCTYDAISVDGNARIDLISGGEYVSYVSDAYIEEWNKTHSYSGINSYALRINSANASVGEIAGGTFLSGDDRSNTGAIINVNAGTLEKISGGYFGFTKFGLQSPWKILFVNTNNGASIGAITGGTYEVYRNNYGCNFADIVGASGRMIMDTEVDVEVKAQFTSSIKSYMVDVLVVVGSI